MTLAAFGTLDTCVSLVLWKENLAGWWSFRSKLLLRRWLMLLLLLGRGRR